MTSLHIDLELETKSHVEIEQLVAACSRLMQLKSIYLDFGYAYFQDEFTDLHDGAFSKLFTNMKKLEEVDILFPMFEEVNVDAAIETLVHNSASVSSIRMRDGRMTDASLHSLSRLTGLQLLAIRSSGRHSDITTEGILSLLREDHERFCGNWQWTCQCCLILSRFGQRCSSCSRKRDARYSSTAAHQQTCYTTSESP